MLHKYKRKNYYLDKLHRGFVTLCMGTTVIGIGIIFVKGYYYYRYIRPAMKEVAMKSNEELLKEGRYVAATN
ncbi:hypothetical protein WH47_03322 [Habropoda laboriosa]|uniref:Uncharacterized protein n=1 Tax=Habropoda laboriosa TaxID=597456 RepID=A0A0L7RBC1_9HYME|nr:hypothetical protein WH47_03322 [Habropoda laboriosa]